MIALQRRLVAVLAADVAGYARLMEEREEETHGRLMRLMRGVVEPAIADHRGRLVKSTGDGFLAAFDDAADAADCALAIQRGFAEAAAAEPEAPSLLFRMGLNIAEAIIEAHDIFGDGVNLAARLQGNAEPGGLVVSEAAARALEGHEGIELADLGELTLKHMRRPARAFALRPRGSRPAPPAPALPPLPDDRPSIAVLPFRTHPPDSEGDYFAEGMIEGIIHILSGIEALFVLSRASTLSYAGTSPDPRAVGRALGVRYVLSGSVHRAGLRLRIATELSDAATGGVIRADRHDGLASELFDIQDRMAAQVVASIAPAVRGRELARAMRKHPDSMTAYDWLLRALDLLYRTERESFDQARGLLQQAVAASPGWSVPHSYAAHWHLIRAAQGWSPELRRDFAEAAQLAARATECDAQDARALAILGHVLSFAQRRHEEAREALDRAVALAPSLDTAWMLSSLTRGYLGDTEAALRHAERALQLSPAGHLLFFAEQVLSQAHYLRGDMRQAILWGRRSLVRRPTHAPTLRSLAAALAAEGMAEEAREMGARLLAVDPAFTLARYAARTPLGGAALDAFLAHLRAAGLPD
ncbi:adenylate/guanylate cyclase domain-containing protein [Crenalkalicoccus roseus]|uniref:adenylate/guanylate cyclase domain-containing protein n=1 Tax=Crenalkalicoccus roseus TaxID=1485588 RepID=UPI001305188E|nr:adenylate/guanylate cyclase domain-containing protein [Crenalkalicoccus roseus]